MANLGNVVWLDDQTPIRVLLELTRPIHELKYIISELNDDYNDEVGALNKNLNCDRMDQDDVRTYLNV